MAEFEIHSLGKAKVASKCNAYIVRATVFNNMNHFACTVAPHKYHLHTHAPIDNVVYHLGAGALTGSHSQMKLNSTAAARWNTFLHPKTQAMISKIAPALKIQIPLKKITQLVKKTGGKIK